MNSIMGLLTMCRRAGKLSAGMDLVKDACKSGSAFGAYAATDISPKTLKELKFVCNKFSVPLYNLNMTMDEIWTDYGKRVGVLAVCDSGFHKKTKTLLEEIPINSAEFFSIDE